MNYNEVESRLQGRNHTMRKFGNNTYLVRHDSYLAMVYHSTEVVQYMPNGNVILNNGGWYTSTTKERINWGLPEGYYLSQDKGVWYLCIRQSNDCFRYQNGITITPMGVEGYAKDNPKADRQYKAKVKAYALKCAQAVPLPKPDAGDCWYCYMVTQDGQTLGDAILNNHPLNTRLEQDRHTHIDDHIAENYIVPSLVYHALKQYGNTDFIMSLVFNNPNKAMLDIAQERVRKSVYRYILQRKGYAI